MERASQRRKGSLPFNRQRSPIRQCSPAVADTPSVPGWHQLRHSRCRSCSSSPSRTLHQPHPRASQSAGRRRRPRRSRRAQQSTRHRYQGGTRVNDRSSATCRRSACVLLLPSVRPSGAFADRPSRAHSRAHRSTSPSPSSPPSLGAASSSTRPTTSAPTRPSSGRSSSSSRRRPPSPSSSEPTFDLCRWWESSSGSMDR